MEYDILLLVVGLVVLIVGGDFLVRGASRVALRLKVSSLVIGLTVVAFGTSSPELFVSIHSVLAGSHDMALGNVIGSNICNLALILGLAAIVTPIPVNPEVIKIDWPMAMGSSLLLYILVLENYLEAHEGAMFMLILVAYIFILIRKSKVVPIVESPTEEELEVMEEKTTAFLWLADAGLIVVGCLGLYFGSQWFISGAVNVFREFEVSDRAIGVLVFAIGTSLPELATSTVAAFKKKTDLALGNLMGSNIFNVLSILGITSMIRPIEVSSLIKEHDIIWMLGITLVLLPMMVYNRRLGRWQGVLLLVLYAYYTYSIFGSK